MKFSLLSRAFDTIDTFDGYTGRFLFKTQPASFETAQPDGAISKRRVLSLAPEYTWPTRRCVRFLGETWLVGDGSMDGMFNTAVRASYWLRKSTDLVTYRTPGQAALGAGGTQAHAQREYLKDTVNGVTDAEYDPQFETFLAKTEAPVKNGYLATATNLWRIRAVRDSLSGFLMLSSDDIGLQSVSTATFLSSTYAPATDTYTGASATAPVLVFDRSKEYWQQTEADPKHLSGDQTMVVAKSSLTPLVGQKITALGQAWRAEAVTSDNDAWSVHLRRT